MTSRRFTRGYSDVSVLNGQIANVKSGSFVTLPVYRAKGTADFGGRYPGYHAPSVARIPIPRTNLPGARGESQQIVTHIFATDLSRLLQSTSTCESGLARLVPAFPALSSTPKYFDLRLGPCPSHAGLSCLVPITRRTISRRIHAPQTNLPWRRGKSRRPIPAPLVFQSHSIPATFLSPIRANSLGGTSGEIIHAPRAS